jgi:hypothetical protein
MDLTKIAAKVAGLKDAYGQNLVQVFFGINYPENMPEADALAIAKSILETGTKVGGFFKVAKPRKFHKYTWGV